MKCYDVPKESYAREIPTKLTGDKRMKKHKTKSHKSLITSNFTLVELLITIAIIAVLASMLLPALNQARSKAKAIKCVSNLKEIGVAVSYYIDDYDGFYPGSITGLNDWGKHLEPYTGVVISQIDNNSAKAKIYYCPSDVSRQNLNPYRSYGQNYYLRTGGLAGQEKYSKVGALKNPSSIIYMADVKRTGGIAGLLNQSIYPMNMTKDPEYSVDFRHSKSSNAVWADMHCMPTDFNKLAGTMNKYFCEN